ncbi:MAG: 30S ribosomal protein S20 [Ignavibacteria bacterium]|jgi:small subunit ribosomal protein S20|nr:30S ribosomal protein S20 [Ignavibacteria bacterium]MDP3830452.1 30S ribosomal protein S20 [Ignavibacteriaceae bacterium]
MANHKSAKKRILVSAKKRAINKSSISKLKTLTKKVLSSTEKTEADGLYKEAVAFIDRIASKGKIHRNTAARRKSALTGHVNGLTVTQ